MPVRNAVIEEEDALLRILGLEATAYERVHYNLPRMSLIFGSSGDDATNCLPRPET